MAPETLEAKAAVGYQRLKPELRLWLFFFYYSSKKKEKIKNKIVRLKGLTLQIFLLSGNLWLRGQLQFLHGAVLKHQAFLPRCCFVGNMSHS